MNKTKQRIKIAEACGWEPCGWRHLALGGVEDWWRNAEENAVARLKELPDYLNDLNAMKSAIASSAIWSEVGLNDYFMGILKSVVGVSHEYLCMALILPTADQLAEAFLRTLGLWED